MPIQERPAQFLPPHCLDGTRNTQHATRNCPTYAPNDLSFYANIPTPCSYMCMGSQEDFFGGYDYAAQAGIVHCANHHISPGKKQWTWGNHEFGYAWDRNLTDKDAQGEYRPYIEIMAGVYTDNQPDFSFLQPGETKAWSQYWYPIQKIGPAQHANLEAAVSLRATQGKWTVGVAVTRRQPQAVVRITAQGRPVASFRRDLSPATPLVEEIRLPKGVKDLQVSVSDEAGRELISCQTRPRRRGEVPPPATEPPAPADIATADELYLIGLHLEQYRHATRSPTPYWQEALRRDPLDARCNNALGLWHFRRGEFTVAETHFRNAIQRLTRRNPNPYDGEAYYNLGLCLRCQANGGNGLVDLWINENKTAAGNSTNPSTHQSINPSIHQSTDPAGVGLLDEAYAAFYKATWNQAWVAAGYHALAEMDSARGHWTRALEHLEHSLRFNTDNTRLEPQGDCAQETRP